MLKKIWKRAYIDRKLILNHLLIILLGTPYLPKWIIWTKINTRSKILDVGCGEGSLLLQLSKIGFKDLTGIDRYMKFEYEQRAGISFSNQNLEDLGKAGEKYDLIMLHHSLEHMSEQLETLKHIGNLLTKDGYLVIRIPLISSFAWRQYGTNWFGLDAPRHFYLHTEQSLQSLADKSGFMITKLYYDSLPEGLWASEQYAQDIPYIDEKSLRFGLDKSIFTKQDLDRFKLKTQELDKFQDGDQAWFFLKRK